MKSEGRMNRIAVTRMNRTKSTRSLPLAIRARGSLRPVRPPAGQSMGAVVLLGGPSLPLVCTSTRLGEAGHPAARRPAQTPSPWVADGRSPQKQEPDFTIETQLEPIALATTAGRERLR